MTGTLGPNLATDWEARFRAERTPWERPTLHPAFLSWRGTGTLSPCRIMLPGAGRSGEPLALAQDGFDVTVVDAAPTAVGVQRTRFQAMGLPGTIQQADLLDWAASAPFDAIYDQTCLCALPPAILPTYAAQLRLWLRPGGRLFVLLMQTGKAGGPPFDCPIEAMRILFGAGWVWPESFGAPVAHNLGGTEIPVVLERG